MNAKKVKAKVVKEENKEGGKQGEPGKIGRFLIKTKIMTAIFLDVIDIFLGNIPIINSLWDIITVGVLLITLKNKRMAYMGLAEIPLFGVPPFSMIDAMLPSATLITLVDIIEEKYKIFGI